MTGSAPTAGRAARARGGLAGPPTLTTDLMYEAFVVRGSVAQRAVISWIGAVVATILGAGVVLCALLAPATTGERVGALGIAVACIVAALSLIRWTVPALIQDSMLVAAIAALGLVGALDGPLAPTLPMVFVVLGTSYFVIRSLQYSLGHLALAGLSYAAVLVFGPDTAAPGTRLVSVMAAILTSGLFMRWLVEQVATVAQAERAARDDAQAATVELLRTSDAKSEFLARMSHELRTPLNVILGFSDALRAGFAGKLTAHQQTCVDDLASSGRDLLSLVDELLDVSKMEAGTIDLQMGTRADAGQAVANGEHPRADLDLDRPFLVPSSRANRALMAHVGAWFSRAAAALFAVLAIITPGSIALRTAIFATAIVALGVGQVIGRTRDALSQRQTDLIGVFGIVAVSVGTLLAGPFADLAPLAYGWNILAAGALLTRFHVLVKLLATITAYGVVVLIDQPPGALQLWIGVCMLVVAHAQTIGWISTRLHELMSEGLSSRLAAEATRAQAEAVSAHKSDFLANTSHELCTPLNAIVGFAQVLDDGVVGPLQPKQAEYVTDILESGRHLLSLITDLLDLGMLETGRLATVRQPVVIAVVVRSVVQDQAAAALRHGIELCTDLSDDLPDLEGDPGHLLQALRNLVANGIKFTDVGGRVEVMAHPNEAEDHVLLSVRDTGIGIPPELRSRVFEAFRQGSASPPEHARGGTGLGLTLAKWLIEIEGGTISVESTPNIGSTFTIELPIPGRPSRDPVLA